MIYLRQTPGNVLAFSLVVLGGVDTAHDVRYWPKADMRGSSASAGARANRSGRQGLGEGVGALYKSVGTLYESLPELPAR
jgi:hypothetical protein